MSTAERHIPVGGGSIESGRRVRVITRAQRKAIEQQSMPPLVEQTETQKERHMTANVKSWINETAKSRVERLAEARRQFGIDAASEQIH